MSRRGAHVVDVGDEGDDVSSTYGSEYMAEESSSGESVSLEVESQSVEDVGGDSGSEMEGRRSRHAKRRSNVPKVEVVWKGFEEVGLMDSFGSDYDGGADDAGVNSPNVSLVSESSLKIGLQGEKERDSRGKKVVPGEKRRRRWKAVGDGLVRREHPLKGEKCSGVSVRGRCALDRVVSMKKSMMKFHKRIVKGTVLRHILKYPTFAMERSLALALVKCWVLRSRAFRLADRLVSFSVFDVALLTGLPVTRKRVTFDDDGVMTDFGEMMRQSVRGRGGGAGVEVKEGWE